eukprot:gnl/TRDRNA2_/TRDRNA2_81359_c0_seq1.p1 gnl/TRDRNA2_/TRDRNA2_81359_c0~~gnl/TRDRNA2_/TRDRNA2_81359_c0_seq1.p1  ORF type:complete len:250 (+),score=15.40 gnl/TRDRNA2_/TRDRNA2_81359_c0_seq1:1-750(+)
MNYRTSRFRSVTVRKLDIMCLTQYAAVQFLDADIMPKTNMDYAFNIVQQSNVTQVYGAGMLEPLNGGWFMAAPSCSVHERLMAIVSEKGLNMQQENWQDVYMGWGAPIPQWTSQSGNGSGWNFHSFFDQGLLYYSARFLSNGTAAIFHSDHFETWSDDGQTVISHPLPMNWKHAGFIFGGGDYEHFTGYEKPWLVAEYRQPLTWRKEFKDMKASLPQHARSFNVRFPLDQPDGGFLGFRTVSLPSGAQT